MPRALPAESRREVIAHVGWQRHDRRGKDWAVVTIADHALAVVTAVAIALRTSGQAGGQRTRR